MTLFAAFFVILLLLVGRHFWRHRTLYARLYSLFKGSRPTTGNSVKEKCIITCPYCGSMPEVTSEPCSKCGRRL